MVLQALLSITYKAHSPSQTLLSYKPILRLPAPANSCATESLFLGPKLETHNNLKQTTTIFDINHVEPYNCDSAFIGKLDDAKPLYEEAIAIWKKVHGGEHHLVATGLNNLAELLRAKGKLDEAMPLYEQSLRITRKVYGNEHPAVATALNNPSWVVECTGKAKSTHVVVIHCVGYGYFTQGDYDGAEKLYNEALVIRLKVLGDDHPDTGTTYNDLGDLYHSREDYAQAEDMLTKAVDVYKKKFGNEHPWVAAGLNNLASLLDDQGKLDDAYRLYEKAIAIWKKVHGDEHHLVATGLNNLALLLWNQDKNSQEADRLGKEALRIAEKRLGKDHPTTQNYRRDWG